MDFKDRYYLDGQDKRHVFLLDASDGTPNLTTASGSGSTRRNLIQRTRKPRCDRYSGRSDSILSC